jgi:hypothetical protein
MKRGVVFIGIVGMALWLSACGSTDIDLGSRPQFANGTAVLTVYVYDGLSGQGVENASLTMRVGPNAINAKRNGSMYTFSNVPAGTPFPIFALANGYLDFVGTTAGNLAGGADVAHPVYTTATLVMYRAQNINNDILVKVYDEKGTPVSSGKVVLTLSDVPPKGFTVTLQNPLKGEYGYRPRSQEYSLANDGTLLISRNDLVYGAEYKLSVLFAMDTTGSYYLSTATAAASATIDPYVEYPQVNFFLAPPTVYPVVVATSNPQPSDDGVAVDSTGRLALTFATPIARCVRNGVHAYWTGTGITTTAAADADDTGFALSNSDLTLTMTPKADPPTAAASVTFGAGVQVRVKSGGQTPCVPLNALCFQHNGSPYDGQGQLVCSAINATVHLRRQ